MLIAPRSPRRSLGPGRIIHVLAFVAGVAAFLRLPLHGAPGSLPEWPPQLPALNPPAAHASVPDDEVVWAPTPNAQARWPAPPEFSSPFFFVAPARASVQTLAGTDQGIAALIDQRLRDLDDFGNPGARGDTLYLLGIERQRSCDFGAAADYFEAFALQPGEGVAAPEAAASLENAIVYRRALGQDARALAAAERFVEIFGVSHPRATTRVQLEAAALGDSAQFRALRRRRLPPAERIQSEVRIGASLWNVSRSEARRAFRRAERTWRRAGGALMARSPGLGDTAWIAELARTREALAEARFAQANQLFRVATRQKAPAFDGVPDAPRVERWMRRSLRPWLERRMALIGRAEAALSRVDELGLSSRSVAAAARRGQLYAQLQTDLLQALPNEVRVDEGRFVVPSRNLEDNLALRRRLVEPAMRHFEHCMESAAATGAYGEWSDRCADGLAVWFDRYRQAELVPAVMQIR